MKNDVKKGIREYIHSLPNKNSLSVTLTMKQGVNNEFLDDLKAQKNFRHFMNLLNKKIYGNAHQRFKKSISVIPVLEKSFEGRIHYHLTLEIPHSIQQNEYEMMIIECWNKTKFGYREIDIQNFISSGWNDYITKFVSEVDTVDWENFHWNS